MLDFVNIGASTSLPRSRIRIHVAREGHLREMASTQISPLTYQMGPGTSISFKSTIQLQ